MLILWGALFGAAVVVAVELLDRGTKRAERAIRARIARRRKDRG